MKKRKSPKKKESLKEIYYSKFGIEIFYGTFSLITFIYLIIIYRDIVTQFSNKVFGYIAICVFLIGMFGVFLFAIKDIIKFIKDYHYVKNEEYEKVTGRVIGFKKNDGEGIQINNIPIIENVETKEVIVLCVNHIFKKNETYDFIYLKNTKYAIIKNKQDDSEH